MKRLWCWRCRAVVAMLDDDEWELVQEVGAAGESGLEVLERERVRRGLPPISGSPEELPFPHRKSWPYLAAYRLITGVADASLFVVRHHVASKYGAPCTGCGRPLRTPVARFCVACGTPAQ